jgi:tetratricopeptide (TPR) repeat protein
MKIFGFLKYILPAVVLMLSSMSAYAQVDKKDVRRGNRDFRKENYREAEIDYRKALVKDSLSLAANYNLASTLYRQGDMEQAGKVLDNVKEVAPVSAAAADYWYNRGDVALEMKDYQAAVEAFAESLKINPGDLDAKENFIYAKKMLQNQQNNQNNQDQNQDQNQNNDQNQDNQDKDDDKQDDQNKNDQDQQNQENQDRNQDQNNDRNRQNEQPKISPQAAQQMLQAIQAKEKETQEKVKEEKAKALKSRQKEKNW